MTKPNVVTELLARRYLRVGPRALAGAFTVRAWASNWWNRTQWGPSSAKLMEVEGNIVLQSRFVTRDGVRIELLRFDEPGYQGPAARRPMNQLGLTHLSVRVQDVDAVAASVRELGGTVFEHTRTKFSNPDGSSYGFRLLHRSGWRPDRTHAPASIDGTSRRCCPNFMRYSVPICTISLMLTAAALIAPASRPARLRTARNRGYESALANLDGRIQRQ